MCGIARAFYGFGPVQTKRFNWQQHLFIALRNLLIESERRKVHVLENNTMFLYYVLKGRVQSS